MRHSAIMNAIIIVHTSLYIYGSIFVRLCNHYFLFFLADWMCGIENMYLCNCIVCLMANSFLEEKSMLFTCLFLFPFFFRGECTFCFVFFSRLQNCIKRSIIIQQQIYWYASTYSSRSVKLAFLYEKSYRLNPIYRANCNH